MRLIIFGIIGLIGGLSGKLALRGTNSSMALTIVSGIMIIIGVVQMIRQRAGSGASTADTAELPPTTEGDAKPWDPQA